MRDAGEWAARRLGYRFRDPALLEAALTHRSASRTNYERLEFLGDSVLNFVVALLAFRAFPDAPEGDLSRFRAALVSAPSLASVAGALDLGDQLRLGGGELKSGGFRRDSILADCLEAVIGAIYLDGGLDAAHETVSRLLGARLAELPAAETLKDPKTRLQEVLQSRGLALPRYALEEVGGEPHEQWFVASCEAAELGLRATGRGSSRRKAEQDAAQKLLETIARGEENA
ncbi:MAG TPA: ribonuclease III [Steroidobacteraceae bacterium]|nr:ribonuclease III [Steroidobacteraceae bacterium]